MFRQRGPRDVRHTRKTVRHIPLSVSHGAPAVVPPGGRTYDRPLRVLEDPRVQVPAPDRKAWTDALLSVAEMYRGASAIVERLGGESATSGDLRRVARELRSRVLSLYRAMSQSTGRPTADQRAQIQFYTTELESLRRRAP